MRGSHAGSEYKAACLSSVSGTASRKQVEKITRDQTRTHGDRLGRTCFSTAPLHTFRRSPGSLRYAVYVQSHEFPWGFKSPKAGEMIKAKRVALQTIRPKRRRLRSRRNRRNTSILWQNQISNENMTDFDVRSCAFNFDRNHQKEHSWGAKVAIYELSPMVKE